MNHLVKRFIQNRLYFKNSNITAYTPIDESCFKFKKKRAISFFDSFFETFHIPPPPSFDVDAYFDFNMPWYQPYLTQWLGDTAKTKHSVEPMLVYHLVHVATHNEWTAPKSYEILKGIRFDPPEPCTASNFEAALTIFNAHFSKGIDTGTTVENIQDLEKTLDIEFPEAFIKLYTIINGFEEGPNPDAHISLYSLDEIKQKNKELSDTICIGDLYYGCSLYEYARDGSGIYTSAPDTPILLTSSFEEFVLLMLNEPDRLH